MAATDPTSATALRTRATGPVAILGICLLVVLVYARGYPGVVGLPHTDQAVFLLEGQAILHGKTPYIDLWDHKGPLLYFLNAFGLILGGGNRIGVWLLEIALACAAYVTAFRAIARAFGTIAATCGVALSLMMSAACLNEGNMSESWGLIFGLFTIALVERHFRSGDTAVAGAAGARRDPIRIDWAAVGVGACGATEFFLRPNLCGTFVAALVTICVLRYRSKEAVALKGGLASICVGLLAVSAPVIVYLASKGAIGAFLDCYFTYNLDYVSQSVSSQQVSLEGRGSRLETFSYGFALWEIGPLAVVGWLFAARDGFRFLRGRPIHSLVFMGLLSLPIEMVASCISRFMFEHYFLLWAAPFTITISLLFASIGDLPFMKPLWTRLTLAAAAFAAVGSLFWAVQSRSFYWILHPGSDRDERLSRGDFAITDFVLRATKPGDAVLIWGLTININYYTGRPLATRFLSQMPLTTQGYASNEIFDEFDKDLRKTRPKFIIDSVGNFGRTIVQSPFPAARNLAGFIIQNYHPMGKLAYGETVFERNAGS